MQKRNCFLVKIKLHIEKIKNNSTIIDYQKTYALDKRLFLVFFRGKNRITSQSLYHWRKML